MDIFCNIIFIIMSLLSVDQFNGALLNRITSVMTSNTVFEAFIHNE